MRPGEEARLCSRLSLRDPARRVSEREVPGAGWDAPGPASSGPSRRMRNELKLLSADR